MVTLKIKVTKNLDGSISGEFVEGLDSVSQNNVASNQVQVVLDNFLRGQGETVRIGYERVDNSEVLKYKSMIGQNDQIFTADLPWFVTNSTASEDNKWMLNVQIAGGKTTISGVTTFAYKQNLIAPLQFKVNNNIKDSNNLYPSVAEYADLEKSKVNRAGDTMKGPLTVDIEGEETVAKVGKNLTVRGREVGAPAVVYSADAIFVGEVKQDENGNPYIGGDIIVELPEASGTMATYTHEFLKYYNSLDELAQDSKGKVNRAGDTMKGPLTVNASSFLSTTKTKIDAGGVQVTQHDKRAGYMSDGISTSDADGFGACVIHFPEYKDFINAQGTMALKENVDKADNELQAQLNGLSVELALVGTEENSQDYVLKAILKDRNDEEISSYKLNLPLESIIVNMSYNKDTKEINLSLANGTQTTVPIGDIVKGLVSEETFNAFKNSKGQPNGLASLNEEGQVPSEQLPPLDYLPTAGGTMTGPISYEVKEVFVPYLYEMNGNSVVVKKSDGNTQATLKYPYKKSGEQTFAMLSDLEEIAGADLSSIQMQINVINQALLQSGLTYTRENEDMWNERVTADGKNIVDGSLAQLIKVVGNTVKCNNLFNPLQIVGYDDQIVYDENEQTLAVNISAYYFTEKRFYKIQGKENTQYTFSANIKQPEGKKIAIVFHYDDGSTSNENNRVLQNDYELYTATSLAGKTLVALSWSYDGGGYNSYMRNVRLNEGTVDLGYQPIFTGLKSASFAGIESKSADGAKISMLEFGKVECGLGTTIDFKNQKIVDNGYTVELDGTEKWEFVGYESDGRQKPTLYTLNILPTMEARNQNAVVTDGLLAGNDDYASGCWWIGVSSKHLFWVDCVNVLDLNKDWVDKENPTDAEQKQAVADFKAYLAQRYAKRNPVTIRYVSATATATETPFTDEQKTEGREYLARKLGREKVIGNDNAEYGANCAITVNYLFATEVNKNEE